ncbi:hypothetical protein OG342_04900 [Streptomyces bobili]|uniref:hypothetical protein n=1 Tax=Streptomyces bobili TaxID=67280 RepID=UPI00224FD56A|nr:hypothetical protein [Streptomyces bobili]MCX5522206.1 hypothetical protein [Streptomyces bobili]
MPYSSDDLARLVQDDHMDAAIGMEDTVAAAVSGDSDSAFEALIRRILSTWIKAFGGVDQPGAGDGLRRILAAARTAVRRILDGVAARGPSALERILPSALALGVEQGAAFVRAASGRRQRPVRTPAAGRALLDEARRIGDMVRERRDRALFLLHPDRTTRWTHLLAGVGAARAVLPAVRAHVAWVVNAAIGQGSDEVTRATAPQRVWVAEQDACTRCLAYAGRVVATGQPFPGGLSWDPRQRRIRAAPVEGPPLHPHCRCRAMPWNEAWTTEGVPFPLALQREAHRSIAYGRARPSESRAARLRAVRELLRTEPDLLPAVEARARRALRTSSFAPAA